MIEESKKIGYNNSNSIDNDAKIITNLNNGINKILSGVVQTFLKLKHKP